MILELSRTIVKEHWEERKVIDAAYIYARKIKKTIHSIKDKNHINSISYNVPEIWIPNLN